jgi:hypothetical protein
MFTNVNKKFELVVSKKINANLKRNAILSGTGIIKSEVGVTMTEQCYLLRYDTTQSARYLQVFQRSVLSASYSLKMEVTVPSKMFAESTRSQGITFWVDVRSIGWNRALHLLSLISLVLPTSIHKLC